MVSKHRGTSASRPAAPCPPMNSADLRRSASRPQSRIPSGVPARGRSHAV